MIRHYFDQTNTKALLFEGGMVYYYTCLFQLRSQTVDLSISRLLNPGSMEIAANISRLSPDEGCLWYQLGRIRAQGQISPSIEHRFVYSETKIFFE